jgi:L-amino acid N-acyltransferase YncA
MHVRDATSADLPDIVAIYDELIDTTTYAYTEHHETVAERARWFAERNARGFPTIVAVDGGETLGVATFGDFRDSIKKPGYRTTVEHSVNVLRKAWGRGVGKVLMDRLFELARERGVHVMVGGIDATNVQSIEFHRRLGFVEVGRMAEIARKHDKWCDLVLMQRTL